MMEGAAVYFTGMPLISQYPSIPIDIIHLFGLIHGSSFNQGVTRFYDLNSRERFCIPIVLSRLFRR